MKALVVALLVAGLLGGCATTRAWEQPDARVLQGLKRDDRVTIVATNGKTYRMRVTQVTDDTVHGVAPGKRYIVAFHLIDSIEVERDHPVAAGFTGFGVVVTGVVVAGLVAAIDNLEQQNWDLCGGN